MFSQGNKDLKNMFILRYDVKHDKITYFLIVFKQENESAAVAYNKIKKYVM